MNYIKNIISKITLALKGEGRGVGLLIMCICVFLPQMAQADALPDVVIGQEAVSSLQNKTYVFKNKVEGVWLTVTNDGKLSVTDTQPVSSAPSTYRSQYFTVTDGAINYSLIDANDPSSGITINDETADIEFAKRRKTEAAQPTVRILDKNNRYVMYVGGKLVSISTTHPNTEWYAYEVTAADHSYSDDGICKYCDALLPPTPVYKADGTVDYYEIGTAAQLWLFAQMVNGGQTKINAKLTDNIDMSALCHAASEGVAQVNWTPIGVYTKNYAGTFDGDGHTISGLYFNNSSTDYVGLFGWISGATIQNVGVVNAYFRGSYKVGGVCGYNASKSTITNCYATGTVSGGDYVGGVCGYTNSNSTITNCYATATVSGKNYVGGVCGENTDSTISNCYATGTVSASSWFVGGVCGDNYSSTITNCYATGTVSGLAYVGGVCGYNEGNSTITNCYATQTKAVGSNSSSTEYCVSGGVTLERFKSGEIAWKLNGSIVDGTWTAGPTTGSQAWYQTLPAAGSGETGTTLPVLTKAADASNYVYPYTKYGCDGTTVKSSGYCNDANATTTTHEYDANGICSVCNAYEPATPVYKADGKTVDYYAICTAAQLWSFAQMVNGGQTKINAKLTNDIDMSALCHAASEGVAQVNWTPIGQIYKNYSGTFDGDNHTISNLYFNNTATYYVGLFGYTSGATIQNVGIVNAYFKGQNKIGGVCGYNYQSSITKCYATGTVSGTGDQVGGVCGYNEGNSTITNCYATGTVSGEDYVGGVCGYTNSNSTITNCYATGTVSGTGAYVGGVCGDNDSNSTITNCYATGTVSGTGGYAGGVCGYNEGNSTITNCYATAAVSGKNYVGGVCGRNYNSTITNCYATQTKAVGSSSSSTEYCVSGGVTLERFKSGEIAWLLNGSVDNDGNWKAGQTNGSQAWYQTIDGDDYPVLTKASDGSNTVYYDKSRTPAYYNLVIVPGDLNADGNITIADLTLLVEILNGRATDTNGTADVDGNGNITTEDANALRNMLLGK